MKTKLIFAVVAAITTGCLQTATAQESGPYWRLAGNSDATSSSRLGTNNAVPLRIYTNGNERVHITTTGNIGLGTTAPVARFEINSTTSALLARFTNSATTGDRTAIIDVKNGNGVLWRYGVGGTNNGLGLTNGQFYIERLGAGALLTISTNGNTGLGTTNPGDYKLKITHGSFGLNLENSTSKDDWELWTSSSSPLNLYCNGNFKGSFSCATGAYTTASDERLKTNIHPMASVLEKINQLKPSTYQFKNGSTQMYDGFIAQDVMKIFPGLVIHNSDKERGLDVYTLDYSGFGVIAIKGIQELQQTINKQQQQIEELKQMVNTLFQDKAASGNAALTKPADIVPGSETIQQNVPNPFTNTTTIHYTLPPKSTTAQVLITDKNGSTLKQVNISGNGKGMVNIDAASLTSGTYNYSLIVDGKVIGSKQMILTK